MILLPLLLAITATTTTYIKKTHTRISSRDHLRLTTLPITPTDFTPTTASTTIDQQQPKTQIIHINTALTKNHGLKFYRPFPYQG